VTSPLRRPKRRRTGRWSSGKCNQHGGRESLTSSETSVISMPMSYGRHSMLRYSLDLWNAVVHRRVHKILSLDAVQSHFSSFHIFTPCKIHFSIILPSAPRSFKERRHLVTSYSSSGQCWSTCVELFDLPASRLEPTG
jgi:hypothetical protein